MAEVLLQFDEAVMGADGIAYYPRVCGRPREDGLWEGWIEFVPEGGGATLRTQRETTQPNRRDLDYWAGGLTTAFLEGSLTRARDPHTPDLRPRSVHAKPTYDAPAPSAPHPASSSAASRGRARAILNPFEVYRQGEEVLREELGALSADHLRNIIRAYDLTGNAPEDLAALSHPALTEIIVTGARESVT